MHEDQLEVDVELVRRLVAAHLPHLAGLPVTAVAPGGTVNAMFRLGAELAVRVPLRGDPCETSAILRREAVAAVELAAVLPVPVPAPVAVVPPGDGFPMPWAVQTWLPGAVADGEGSLDLAMDLADLVLAMRRVPRGPRRFTGGYRGGELSEHDTWVAECLERSAELIDTPSFGRLWERLRVVPRPAVDVMSHGDLIPANLLVDRGGRLSGLLDLGTVGPADPALDLVCAWHCLGAEPRARFRSRVGSEDAEWARGQAWALEQALGLVWYYARSNPPMSALGARTLQRIAEDPAR